MPLRPRHSARAKGSGFWRHWSLWLYFPVALLLVMGGVCLWKSGKWLVADDPFDKVAWTVVLAGESRDVERTEAALKLYLDGRIDTVVYSATRIFKDRFASEFMVDYMARQGYPREKLFEYRQDLYSTHEEARELIKQFRFQGLDTVLIITSNFHSARTRRIFRNLAQGYPHILVHAAAFDQYDPEAWWSSREGRKTWLTEWTKTVATYFELMGDPPETGKAESSGLIGASTPAPGADHLHTLFRDSSTSSVASDSAGSTDSSASKTPDSAGLQSSDAPSSADTLAKSVPAASAASASDSSAKPEVRKTAKDTSATVATKEPKPAAKDPEAKATPVAKATSTGKESSAKKETKSSTKKDTAASKSSTKKAAEKEKSEKEKPKKKTVR